MRSQRVQWALLHPQDEEKKLGVIHRENLYVHPQHPQAEQESILGHFLLCQEDLKLELVVLDRQLFQEKNLHRLLEARSKIRSSTL